MLSSEISLEQIVRDRIGSIGALRYRTMVRSYHGLQGLTRTLDRYLGAQLAFGEPLSANDNPELVSNYTLLYPAENIYLGDPARDPFLRSCQFVEDGCIYRANIFVCEVSNAKFYPKIGLVFTHDWRPIVESILDRERLSNFKQLLRPRSTTKRQGTYSSIEHLWHFRNWHWMADCIPQVCSLARYMQGRPLTLLMPSELGKAERESLECIIPPNFTLEYVDAYEWFEVENFILPSHVSSRANALFPSEYYEFIRSRTFASLGIVPPKTPAGRYYISRSNAKHRRVLNEPELLAMLEEFGFESVLMEHLGFREQVELFSNAEAIVSPHSAALGSLMYGGPLKICVLYPEAHPGTYFYTLARGIGQEHFYLTGTRGENDDFSVDLAALRDLLTRDMRLDRGVFPTDPSALADPVLLPVAAVSA